MHDDGPTRTGCLLLPVRLTVDTYSRGPGTALPRSGPPRGRKIPRRRASSRRVGSSVATATAWGERRRLRSRGIEGSGEGIGGGSGDAPPRRRRPAPVGRREEIFVRWVCIKTRATLSHVALVDSSRRRSRRRFEKCVVMTAAAATAAAKFWGAVRVEESRQWR